MVEKPQAKGSLTAINQIYSYLHDWAEFRVANSNLPGLSFAIRSSDGTLCEVATGFASGDTSMTPQHMFDIASQTKLFTSLLVCLLHQDQRLNLFDSVSVHIPQFQKVAKGKFADVTIFDLLTHQSGMPRDSLLDFKQLDVFDQIDKTVEVCGLNPTPSYSNIAYHVLGKLIESVVGESFEDLVVNRICVPLGLTDTACRPPSDNRRSRGHSYPLAGRRELTTVERPMDEIGATGLWSSPGDLVKLVSAHFKSNSSLLDASTKALMHAIHWGPLPSTRIEFAMGLETRWMAGTKYLGHSGGAYGFTSATYFDPRNETAFSVCLNSRDSEVLGQIAENLAFALKLMGDELGDVDGSYSKFAGRFRGDIGCTDIVPLGSRIYMLDPLSWKPLSDLLNLEVINSETLKVGGDDFDFGNQHLRYSFAEDGNVEHLDLGAHRSYPLTR